MPGGDDGRPAPPTTSVTLAAGPLAPSPGVDGTVLVVVGDARDETRLWAEIRDGRPVSCMAAGESDRPADLTLSLPAAAARAIVDGDLQASVAYMQGRLKTAGDNRLLLALLATTVRSDFSEWLAALRPTLSAFWESGR